MNSSNLPVALETYPTKDGIQSWKPLVDRLQVLHLPSGETTLTVSRTGEADRVIVLSPEMRAHLLAVLEWKV